jgi:hypothetical protein
MRVKEGEDMNRQSYKKESEIVAQILRIDKCIEQLNIIRMAKIRSLARAVKNNQKMDKEKFNIPWLTQDLEELNLLVMDN